MLLVCVWNEEGQQSMAPSQLTRTQNVLYAGKVKVDLTL